MTKKDKVINWVTKNFNGFELNSVGGNGRYGTSWTFFNKESKDCIHIYNNAGTNDYEVEYYENAIEYKKVEIFTGIDEKGNHLFRSEMRWEKKYFCEVKSKTDIKL